MRAFLKDLIEMIFSKPSCLHDIYFKLFIPFIILLPIALISKNIVIMIIEISLAGFVIGTEFLRLILYPVALLIDYIIRIRR